MITSTSVFCADQNSDSQAKFKSSGSLHCESFEKDPNSDGYKACLAMEIVNSELTEVYAKMAADKYKKMFEQKKLSAEEMKKFNSYLDYKPSLNKEFSNCSKVQAEEISCPEGTYKFIGGKTGEAVQDSLKRNSKEKVIPSNDDSAESSKNAVSK